MHFCASPCGTTDTELTANVTCSAGGARQSNNEGSDQDLSYNMSVSTDEVIQSTSLADGHIAHVQIITSLVGYKLQKGD